VGNIYDFAWCDVPNEPQSSLTFPQIGEPAPPQDNIALDRVMLYCNSLDLVEGTIMAADLETTFYMVQQDKVYCMYHGFEVSFGQDGDLFGPGTSGALVIRQKDRAIVGMVTGAGRTIHGIRRIYMSLFPANFPWG